MNCQDTRNLIHGYMDGELDLVKSLEVEQHLRECADCARMYQNQMALRTAVQDGALYYPAPASLQKRVLSSLRQASHDPPSRRVLPWRWLSAAAALAVIALVAFGLARVVFTPSADDLLTQQVIASHVRSEITNHQVDVATSDQHTVKPWFNGKLDFSPGVVDLTSQGFPLIGGRLDYVDNRPVAALVYRRQQHIINLFIWPATGAADMATQSEMRQGYNVSHWTKAGMTYWAVTDLNETEFHQFVRLVQAQIAQSDAP